MREIDILEGYSPQKRICNRTIDNKIVASYRDERYYDGDRADGYGGFTYDNRWVPIARRMCDEYGLDNTSKVWQIGCEKGFLLHELHRCWPRMKIFGSEQSSYAINNAIKDTFNVRRNPEELTYRTPMQDVLCNRHTKGSCDLVIAIGVVYTLTLADCISCIKEIERASRHGQSFITLGAYYDDESEKLFRNWSVLGCTILHVDEWVKVLEHCGYTGDYEFKTAKSLNLAWED